MTSDIEEEKMNYGLTADEHLVLQRELDELPDAMPPRIVWQRIRDQAEAEGLIRQPAHARRSTWLGGIGLAAAAALVFVLAPGLM